VSFDHPEEIPEAKESYEAWERSQAMTTQTKAERVAEIEAEYQSELRHWGTSSLDHLARTAYRVECDAKIAEIEAEEALFIGDKETGGVMPEIEGAEDDR
jgi:hypothetical protein